MLVPSGGALRGLGAGRERKEDPIDHAVGVVCHAKRGDRVERSEPLAEPDYVEIVDAETLEGVTRVRGACLALLAVKIGATRLLDNMLIEEREGGFVATL